MKFTPNAVLAAEVSTLNAREASLVSNPVVIAHNLLKLYNDGIARNETQYKIIESLIQFKKEAGFNTPKQITMMSSIILQNAGHFSNADAEQLAADVDAKLEREAIEFENGHPADTENAEQPFA